MLCGILSLVSAATLAAAPAVSTEPTPVVLGKTELVKVHVRANGDGPLRAFANVGTFDTPWDETARELDIVWRPPASRAPATALLLFWREAGPTPEIAALRIPLLGRTELEIDTEPHAEVRVEVGEGRFGPVKADATGKAVVPIEVPPGIKKARVVAQSNKRTTTRGLELDVPAPNPLAAVVIPSTNPPAGTGWLFIFHAQRLDSAKLDVAVEGGTAERVQTLDDRAIYKLRLTGDQAHVVATLRGDPAARAEADAHAATGSAQTPAASSRVQLGGAVGGFYAGGKSGGPAVLVTFGFQLPILSGRLFSELDVGFRSGFLSGTDLLLGRFDTNALVVPMALALRGRFVERPRWAMDARVGAGIAPFHHSTRPELQPSFDESGLGFTVFGAVQASYRLLPLELFMELQVGATPLNTRRIHADVGGLMFLFGARYGLL